MFLVEKLLQSRQSSEDFLCTMQYIETDLQQLQIKLRHEPRSAADALEAEYSAAAKAKQARRPIGFELRTDARPGEPRTGGAAAAPDHAGAGSDGPPVDPIRRLKKRRKDGRRTVVVRARHSSDVPSSHSKRQCSWVLLQACDVAFKALG